MLDHFNEFESGAKELERTNHSLEIENEEASRRLNEAERELHHLQEILSERDNEIAANNRQITELNSQLNDVERDMKRREEEHELQHANSNAIKELCSKLDIEKEKLKEELNECSNIRRKLEQENEKLRKDLAASETLDQQAAVQKLQELLSASKSELEQLRATLSEKSTEVQKLREKLTELKEKYEEEQENSKRYQALSQENSVQIQELNRKLTNYRYEAKVGKEQMQKDDFDRNKIFNEEIRSDTQTESKYLDSISTNSENSRKLKNRTSDSNVEPPVIVYRRKPLSVIKPSTANGQKRISHLDHSESSEDLNSTINAHIPQTKQVDPLRNVKNDKLSRKKIDSSFKGGTSDRKSLSNEFNDQLKTSFSQLMDSGNETETIHMEKSFLETIPSFEVNHSATILPVQENSTLSNIPSTTNSESREEFFTCESSSTISHIGYQKSMTKSKKQSNYKTLFLPQPPTIKKAYTMSNQTATLNIRMESHMGPIHAFRGDYVINSLK